MAYNINQRRNARLAATQALYTLEFNDFKDSHDVLIKFLSFHETDLSDLKMDVSYFKDLYNGTINHIAIIDSYIRKYCSRDFDRIDNVEKAILRYSTYELIYKSLDAPIVIKEAVKIAQEIGSEKGYSLINSYLDQLAKKELKINSNNKNKEEVVDNDITI